MLIEQVSEIAQNWWKCIMHFSLILYSAKKKKKKKKKKMGKEK